MRSMMLWRRRKKRRDRASGRGLRPSPAGKATWQMLDAAHGASVGTGSCVQWVDVACGESKITRIVVAGGERRRTVVVAIRADVRQGSRLAVADARSRSLDSNRWDECRGWPSGKIRSRRMDNWRRRWSVPAFGFRCSGAEAASGLLNLHAALAGAVASATPGMKLRISGRGRSESACETLFYLRIKIVVGGRGDDRVVEPAPEKPSGSGRNENLLVDLRRIVL